MAVIGVVCSGVGARHSHTPITSSRSHQPDTLSCVSNCSPNTPAHLVGHRPRMISIRASECGHHCHACKLGIVTEGSADSRSNHHCYLCNDGIVMRIARHLSDYSASKRWHVPLPVYVACCHHCLISFTMVTTEGNVTLSVNLYVYADCVWQRFTTSVCVCAAYRSDSDDDEIDDKTLNNILIVTQTPPYMKKHPQGDRHPNPDYLPRAKMTAEIAKMINDGLCYYEEELWTDAEVIIHYPPFYAFFLTRHHQLL